MFGFTCMIFVTPLRLYFVQSIWGLWQKYDSYLKKVEYFSKYFNLNQKTMKKYICTM